MSKTPVQRTWSPAREPTETVPAGPFLGWLDEQDRGGWTIRLSATQLRYVDRMLQRRPENVNVHSVDAILVALDLPWILSVLYPAPPFGEDAD